MTADFIRDFTAGMTHDRRLKQVRFIARLMDDQLALPGTNIRFELDSILGLFPGLGDALTSAISLLIVHHAWQSGASKLTLARMLGNVGVYFLVGSVPLVGDLFDVVFKATARMRTYSRPISANKRRARWRFCRRGAGGRERKLLGSFEARHFVVREDAAAGQEAHTFRRFQREARAAAGHHIDDQLGVLPIGELVEVHIDRGTADLAKQSIIAADAELARRIAHGGRAVAATA